MSEQSEVSTQEPNVKEGPSAPSPRSRGKSVLVAAGVLVAVVAVLVVAWPSKPALKGSVIAYRAVDDSAFLVWRVYEPTRSGWLSRVDAKGRTLWLRELPGDPHALDSIHVGSGIVAVRYTHLKKGGAEGEDHAIVAFTFDGKQLWDRVLSPYYPQPVSADVPAYGKTTPSVGRLGGVGAADSFIAWADTEKEIKMTGLRARDGQPAWERVVEMPSTAQAFGSRLLWVNTTGGLTRALDKSHPGFALVNSTEVTTGVTQEVLTRGKGCTIGGNYLAVIDRDGVPALVQYEGAALDKMRVLAERFDPLGDNKGDYFLEGCGRFTNELVFLVQLPQRNAVGDTGRRLVITDGAGVPQRSLDLEFDLDAWMGPNSVEAVSPDQVPFSGELPRFVPIVQARRADVLREEVAMFDLREASVARDPVERMIDRTLFRHGDHWVLASKPLGRTLQLTTYNGNTGKIDGHATVRGRNGHAVVDTPILPTHVANGKLWVVLYDDTPLDAPTLAILDAKTLKAQATRGNATVSNASAAR